MKTFKFIFTSEAFASVEVNAENIDEATEIACDIAQNGGLEWDLGFTLNLDLIDIYDIEQNTVDSVLKYETQICLGDM